MRISDWSSDVCFSDLPFPAGCSPTWEGWTDDVIAVMDAAGSRRAVIHGERDGGITALLFAATHPERVQALSLGNTTARYQTGRASVRERDCQYMSNLVVSVSLKKKSTDMIRTQ